MKMKIKCHRCKYEWVYTGIKKIGKYPQYITCPHCKTSVKLKDKFKEIDGKEDE